MSSSTQAFNPVVRSHLSHDQLGEYRRLAEKLNFRVGQTRLVTEDLLAFCAEAGIMTYDAEQVAGHMDQLARAASKPWVWVPMRKTKNLRNYEFQHRHWVDGRSSMRCGDVVSGRTYDKPIPLSVLYTAEKLVDKFPEIGLFVTDYEVRKPDPFLAAAFPRSDFVIVEVWNEPTFKPQ